MNRQNEIYECSNPFWLSDTFIFRTHEKFGTIYVKVNCHNKIEEIGIDIEKRMHNTLLEDIKKKNLCRPATKFHKSILNRIGDEYWYMLMKISAAPVKSSADTINAKVQQRLTDISISNRLRSFVNNHINDYISNNFNKERFIEDITNYILDL